MTATVSEVFLTEGQSPPPDPNDVYDPDDWVLGVAEVLRPADIPDSDRQALAGRRERRVRMLPWD